MDEWGDLSIKNRSKTTALEVFSPLGLSISRAPFAPINGDIIYVDTLGQKKLGDGTKMKHVRIRTDTEKQAPGMPGMKRMGGCTEKLASVGTSFCCSFSVVILPPIRQRCAGRTLPTIFPVHRELFLLAGRTLSVAAGAGGSRSTGRTRRG